MEWKQCYGTRGPRSVIACMCEPVGELARFFGLFYRLVGGGTVTFCWPVTCESSHVMSTSYLLYGSGPGEVQIVVPLSLTMADDQQEILV